MSQLRNNTADSRYELDFEGGTVFAAYQHAPGVLTINWVEAPPALRGTGAAGKLMTLVAEGARRDGLKIVPVCGYAAAWLRRSKAYGDLVA
jgi:predicted GNAT family acetyltransferase